MRYLKQKAIGGSVNQRGNDYEICYAIYSIMLLANRLPVQAHLVTLSTQVLGFVDDLYIRNLVAGEITESYYQLKTSEKLSWGKESKAGSLRFDFIKQKKRLSRRKVNFQLVLVVAQPRVYASLKNHQPKPLIKRCSIESFPWAGSINQQIISVSSFRKMAESLCAFTDIDKLASLVSHFVGAWIMIDKKNVSLEEILQLVRSRGTAFLKSSLHHPLRPDVKAILDTIAGFDYQIVNGYFAWHFSTTDQGFIPHALGSVEFRNIEDEIVKKRPTTFADIETLIS